ncbi:SRPBCC family protein [Rhodobacter lacus]|uniref:SRPBCC family protein n=1 Tax=Rhodobacter lacus TaxID=1641972 RepID=A0ABW5A7E1_9RHOB
MKFSNRVDVAVSADRLFAQLTDVAGIEEIARRKGVSMRRLDTLREIGAGMSWEVGFMLRGKPREMIVDVARFEPGRCTEYAGISSSFEVTLTLDFTTLEPNRTRLGTMLELRPRTLGARLLLQSARLGRANLDRRYNARIKSFLREIEARA